MFILEENLQTDKVQCFRIEFTNTKELYETNNDIDIVLKGVEPINKDIKVGYGIDTNDNNEAVFNAKDYGKIFVEMLQIIASNLSIGYTNAPDCVILDIDCIKKVIYPKYAFFFDIEKVNGTVEVKTCWYSKTLKK